MRKEKTAAERREKLAILLFCRSYLYYSDMLTEAEARKVFNKIRAYQHKHTIAITREQIDSVEIKYKAES